MPRCFNTWQPLLLLTALWGFLNSASPLAGPLAIPQGKSKDHIDPNVRDWGDYSDLPPGTELAPGLKEGQGHGDGRESGDSTPGLAPELDFLAEFAGKKRLWVITAPSHNDHYLRMMEKQLEDTDQQGLNCRLAERDTFIITIIQNAMMEGRIQKTTFQGDTMIESLDPEMVTRLLHFLELTSQDQAFNMLILKKNLRVSERFPYPVRVEAILELIDQFPVRKLEKITRKGSGLRCKTATKKVLVKRRRQMKKVVLSSQRKGNVTSLEASPRRPPPNKKAALRSKIQAILNGRSRFVIKKVPAGRHTNGRDMSRGGNESPAEKVKKDRPVPAVSLKTKNQGGKNNEDDGAVKQSYRKKGKGKKGKKGKGRGRKSDSELSEKDKAALREFLDKLKGTRRLMVISTPTREMPLYIQQSQENEKMNCDLAVRRVTVATVVGVGDRATLALQHHQLELEPPLTEPLTDPGLIPMLRSELGLSSPDLFSMTVTDYDLKPSRVFEAPPSSIALLEYIDNFSSRRPEKEKERKSPPACSRDTLQAGAQNSLLRFMSQRRLLIISAPSQDDYSFQQQLTALRGQDCHLGVRHFALLKLTGDGDRASGTVQLFPLNGRSHSETEPLSRDVVNNLREQLKISKDYFSVLVVGKDGSVKAWFPSPLWLLDNVYDLVDSLELRLQEEKLQRALGIHCPEERGRGGGEGTSYHDEDGVEEAYLYHRPEE